MDLRDLVRSKDGSLSLTKLAAATAHLNMAVAFAWVTLHTGFISEMWMIYGGLAVAHAGYDKTAAMVKAYKERSSE